LDNKNLFDIISGLGTEKRNPRSANIDDRPLKEILTIINDEDKTVAYAVSEVIDKIEIVTEKVIACLRGGGRLIYIGAGTSGRLGVLDAAECPPTFGTEPSIVQGLMAGGEQAMFVAQEGAEDSVELPITDLKKIVFEQKDILIGLAASGRTPYVLAGIDYARSLGSFTSLITTVTEEQAKQNGAKPDIIIDCPVGPEVVTGSTRMKSGTAQKLILNMITTAAMVSLGKTLGNVMVDLKPTNAKLIERSKKTVMELTGISYYEAQSLLESAQYHVKSALVMHFTNCELDEARVAIEKANGKTREAIKLMG
jgi:N-acetylmuramic acid 6-phosphate etherase